MYPGVGTFVLIRPTQTFYERINLKLLYNLGIMAAISGANLLIVPMAVSAIFSNLSPV